MVPLNLQHLATWCFWMVNRLHQSKNSTCSQDGIPEKPSSPSSIRKARSPSRYPLWWVVMSWGSGAGMATPRWARKWRDRRQVQKGHKTLRHFTTATCHNNVKIGYWNGHITNWFITCHHFEIPSFFWDFKNCLISITSTNGTSCSSHETSPQETFTRRFWDSRWRRTAALELLQHCRDV